jgi:hypothetical protein
VAALLLAAQVVRNAAVHILATDNPDRAARIWKDHPSVQLSLGMTEIARAAHDRKPVPESVFALMRTAAVREPLAPEPFLVRGVQAQLAGNLKIAQRSFEEAQWRDPRSLPAAYFLADRYFRAGDSEKGLREVAALARLAPNGLTTVAPYLAAYATDPATWPKVRSVFRANPSLAEVTLTRLASNIETVPAVLALANRHEPPAKAEWLAPLLNTLTGAGQYDRARGMWKQAAGVQGDPLIYDPSFRDKVAPAPFNWALTSSGVGLAERQPGGRLHLVFYGQEDGILATQLLLLRPGTYRFSMQLLGDLARAKALSWSIWCDKSSTPIAAVTLDAAASRGWSFAIPVGCPAQWLRLSGLSSDMPQQVDVAIASLRIERVGPRA